MKKLRLSCFAGGTDVTMPYSKATGKNPPTAGIYLHELGFRTHLTSFQKLQVIMLRHDGHGR